MLHLFTLCNKQRTCKKQCVRQLGRGGDLLFAPFTGPLCASHSLALIKVLRATHCNEQGQTHSHIYQTVSQYCAEKPAGRAAILTCQCLLFFMSNFLRENGWNLRSSVNVDFEWNPVLSSSVLCEITVPQSNWFAQETIGRKVQEMTQSDSAQVRRGTKNVAQIGP